MSGPAPPFAVLRSGTLAVARLAGEIDAATVDSVEAGVTGGAGDAGVVVVDLTAVEFLDSAGLRLLDRLVGWCDRRRVGVRVVAPVGSPTRLPIEVCGFRPGLVSGTLAEALADLPRARDASGG